MSTFEGPMMAIKTVNALSHYTDWTIGHVHAGALGWVAMISIGSLYHLIPKVFGRPQMHSIGLINAHFWLATIGTVLYIASMWVNGITQGLMWRAVNEGCGGLWTTDTGSPIVIRGKDKLAEHAVWSLKCFPDWEWYNINIFGTDDPNHFWVECDGHGKILFPGYPEGYYENHFLHSFELEDGKIKRNREFMNVFQQLRAARRWPMARWSMRWPRTLPATPAARPAPRWTRWRRPRR